MECVNPVPNIHRGCYFNRKNFGSIQDASWTNAYICAWCQIQAMNLISFFLREPIVWSHGEWVLRSNLLCEYCDRSHGEIRYYHWGRSPDGRVNLHAECVSPHLKLNRFNSNIPV